jgi:hypothetical protein
MLTPEVRAMVEAGSALIVGLVDDGGMPLAIRGWGLDVGEERADRLDATLLLRPVDLTPLGLVPGYRGGRAVAVTATDVLSLDSVQLKGRIVAVEEADDADRARKDRYCDLFFADIVDADGCDPRVAERWRPDEVVRTRVVLDESFVQTPGPNAGDPIGSPG